MVLGNLQYDLTNYLGLFFFRILREICYSLSCVIDKYIMEKKFGSVYEILLSNGIILLVMFSIFSIFDYYFFGLDNYKEFFNNFSYIEFLVILGVLISQLGLNLCITLTNRDNTPCHIFIIFVFGQLAYYFDFSGISIIIIICLLLILFISLIFIEIIELNFWGLSQNVKRNIMKENKMTVN